MEWHNGRMAEMADGMVEWRLNGGMAGMAGMVDGMVKWRPNGGMARMAE